MNSSYYSSLVASFLMVFSWAVWPAPGAVQNLQTAPGDALGAVKISYTNPTTGIGSITSREIRIKVEGSTCSLQVVRGSGWNCPLVVGITDSRGTFGSSQILLLPKEIFPGLDITKKYQLAIRLWDSQGPGPVSNVVGMKWVRLAWNSVSEAQEYWMYTAREEGPDTYYYERHIGSGVPIGLLGGLPWGRVNLVVTASETGRARESFFSNMVTDHR